MLPRQTRGRNGRHERDYTSADARPKRFVASHQSARFTDSTRCAESNIRQAVEISDGRDPNSCRASPCIREGIHRRVQPL